MGGQVRNQNQGCFMEENSTQPAIAQRRFTTSALQGWGETLRMCLAQRGPTRAMAATKPRAARRQTTEKLNYPSRWLRTQKEQGPHWKWKRLEKCHSLPLPTLGRCWKSYARASTESIFLDNCEKNNNNKSKFVSEKNRLQVFKSVSWLNLHKYSPSLPLFFSLSF